MRLRSGFTLLEMMVSLVLFGSMLATVFATFTTSQSVFFTTEAFVAAQQSSRNALDVIQQDLAGAQIYSYYVGAGNGKVYVKFHRLRPGIVNANGNLNWQTGLPPGDPSGPMLMYIWCPAGLNGPLDPVLGAGGGNICAQIVPTPPGSRELLLVQAAAANPQGRNDGQWVRVRVVANNLQNPTANVPDPDPANGFAVTLTQLNGTPVTPANTGCPPGGNGGSPTEVCVNNPGNAFGLGSNPNAPLFLRLGLSVRTRARTSIGRVVRSGTMQGNVDLRNRQDGP